MTTLGLCIIILDIIGLKWRFIFNIDPLFHECPPWSLTIHYLVPSNIDEMSILATLQRKGARKEKNQNQETSRFESLSCSRWVFYILIIVVGAKKTQLSTIYICGEIWLKLLIWWNLSTYDWVCNNWMVCLWTNMMVIICCSYLKLKRMK